MKLPDEAAVMEELLRLSEAMSKHCIIKGWTIAEWELNDKHEPPILTEIARSRYELEDLKLAVSNYLSHCRDFILNSEEDEIEINLTSIISRKEKVKRDLYIIPTNVI